VDGCGVLLVRGFRVDRQRRQRVQRAGHIEQLRVRVHVGGQLRVAVPHGSLRRPQRDTALAQMGPERVPQRMHVNGSSPLIPLRNPREKKVAIQDLD
jgi:hypothetical protein